MKIKQNPKKKKIKPQLRKKQKKLAKSNFKLYK